MDKEWNGVSSEEFAEHMGYHLGSAFMALWHGKLDVALKHLEANDLQRAPLPGLPGHLFRARTTDMRKVFSRPSPWCEPVRFALAAICNMCASEHFGERARISVQAIQCVRTAIDDDKCMGRGLEP